MNTTIKTSFILTLIFSITLLLSCNSKEIYDTGKGIEINLSKGKLSLLPLSENSIRVQVSFPETANFEELIYTEKVSTPTYKIKKNSEEIILELERITAVFNKKNETLLFKNENGEIILQEQVSGRSISSSTIQGEPTFNVEQRFVSPEDEYLYGTGQFQDGYLNIKGLTRRLTQVNTQISIPFILSNKGYGLLWNNYGLTDFNPADNFVELKQTDAEGQIITVDATGTSGNRKETRNINAFTAYLEVPSAGRYSLLLDVGQSMARKHFLTIDSENIINVNNIWLPPTTSVIVELSAGKHEITVEGERNDKPVLYWREVTNETTFRSPVAQQLDYTVFAGNGDEVIAGYRELTGPAPMMPLWAMGYIHCRERYNTQSELLENAREFRERKMPVDVIVQDWQYWGKYGWNAMRFDDDRYPDPAAMVRQLHEMNIRLMISVWAKIDKNSELGKQAENKGYYISGTEWIDFFNPEAAGFYWNNFSEKMLKPYQIDAWWQDATEPENDDLVNRRINNGELPGEMLRNVFPLYVNKTVYEGLRKDNPEKRVMILTRSGFSGIQRYAAATWSGDVGHDWETLRRQISGGLGQMATGVPWWTYDAGGFFRPYDQYSNPQYQEQFIRWFQAATFFPLLRVHGYMSNAEPWRYGKEVENVVLKYLNLRYQLLPYIYSNAAAVSFNGSTLMRPLVMDFPADKKALEQQHQYMFGKNLLIAPVTEGNVKSWRVYLPEYEAGWIDFWTGEKTEGGNTVDVPVDISKIPLFVKAGSIIPFGPEKQYSMQKSDKPDEIRIYPGADDSFTVYEDEGDNYNYEKGGFSTFDLKWDDNESKLYIGERKGSFPNMTVEKKFRIVLVGNETIGSTPAKEIVYSGSALQVDL